MYTLESFLDKKGFAISKKDMFCLYTRAIKMMRRLYEHSIYLRLWYKYVNKNMSYFEIANPFLLKNDSSTYYLLQLDNICFFFQIFAPETSI